MYMNNNELRLFAAALRQDLEALDVHGLRAVQAVEQLELFISRLLEKGESEGRVIFGVGTGVLHDKVIHHLQNSPLVARIDDNGSSCVFILK